MESLEKKFYKELVRYFSFCFYFMKERAKKPEDRDFAEMMDLFPRNARELPVQFNASELSYLDGSPFQDDIKNQLKNLKRQYADLCELVPELNEFGFSEFCDVNAILSSRLQYVTMDGKETPCLIPLADMFNHRTSDQPQTRLYYFDMKRWFAIRALENIKAGDEICLSYGYYASNLELF